MLEMMKSEIKKQKMIKRSSRSLCCFRPLENQCVCTRFNRSSSCSCSRAIGAEDFWVLRNWYSK